MSLTRKPLATLSNKLPLRSLDESSDDMIFCGQHSSRTPSRRDARASRTDCLMMRLGDGREKIST